MSPRLRKGPVWFGKDQRIQTVLQLHRMRGSGPSHLSQDKHIMHIN